MMKILALDTATECISIALLEDQKVIAEETQYMNRGQGEALIPMIQNLIQKTGVNLSDIRKIAVSVGPGSFTGVRIGLATARGMGLALGIPVRGVTTLQALATGTSGQYIVAIDTKRGDFYTQIFQDGTPTEDPKIRTEDDIAALNIPVIKNDFQTETSHLLSSAPYVAPAIGVGLSCQTKALPAEPVYLRDADVSC